MYDHFLIRNVHNFLIIISENVYMVCVQFFGTALLLRRLSKLQKEIENGFSEIACQTLLVKAEVQRDSPTTL